MGIIEDKKKFKTKTQNQTDLNNPTKHVNQKTNKFDIDKKTIKDQQTKK
ncbi:hypothetical protein [Winogradskyella bathintestinalis]|uniref:Uncharacterized protein n=1 Tax=Winogradskyella bathintestinalis TaxID=3035208 RepID=A0ABT7ZYN0_9FLAO|nr:hypothetical protein [Winogradskyella bathintestinalis]MDN3494097.1 hypothetical protein [Winogradskyella bathintestinalis]